MSQPIGQPERTGTPETKSPLTVSENIPNLTAKAPAQVANTTHRLGLQGVGFLNVPSIMKPIEVREQEKTEDPNAILDFLVGQVFQKSIEKEQAYEVVSLISALHQLDALKNRVPEDKYDKALALLCSALAQTFIRIETPIAEILGRIEGFSSEVKFKIDDCFLEHYTKQARKEHPKMAAEHCLHGGMIQRKRGDSAGAQKFYINGILKCDRVGDATMCEQLHVELIKVCLDQGKYNEAMACFNQLDKVNVDSLGFKDRKKTVGYELVKEVVKAYTRAFWETTDGIVEDNIVMIIVKVLSSLDVDVERHEIKTYKDITWEMSDVPLEKRVCFLHKLGGAYADRDHTIESYLLQAASDLVKAKA